jgi:hypothetical protein
MEARINEVGFRFMGLDLLEGEICLSGCKDSYSNVIRAAGMLYRRSALHPSPMVYSSLGLSIGLRSMEAMLKESLISKGSDQELDNL